MATREPDEATSRRAPDGASDANRETGMRAVRRRRRHDEAGIQSLVRRLATQMSPERDR
jgi:hypothetical protein